MYFVNCQTAHSQHWKIRPVQQDGSHRLFLLHADRPLSPVRRPLQIRLHRRLHAASRRAVLRKVSGEFTAVPETGRVLSRRRFGHQMGPNLGGGAVLEGGGVNEGVAEVLKPA